MHPYRGRGDFPGLSLKDFNLADVLIQNYVGEVLLYTGRDFITVGREFAEVLDELKEGLGALYAGINITGKDNNFSRQVRKILEMRKTGLIGLNHEDLHALSSDGLVLQYYCVHLEKGKLYDETKILIAKTAPKIPQESSADFGFPTYL